MNNTTPTMNSKQAEIMELVRNIQEQTSVVVGKMIVGNSTFMVEELLKLENIIKNIRLQVYTDTPPAPPTSPAPVPPTSPAPAPPTAPALTSKEIYDKQQALLEKKRQKLYKSLENVEEVEFQRPITRIATSTVSKEDWLEENAEDVPSTSHDKLWLRFLELMGAQATWNKKMALVELDGVEEDENDSDDVCENDDYPDMEDLLKEFKITKCELCEDDLELENNSLEDYLWEKTTYVCSHCEDLLDNKHKKFATFLSFKTKTDS